MKKATIVNGSYRRGGATDQVLGVISDVLRQAGFETAEHRLVDLDLKYCRNCRACTQPPGQARGPCVIRDDAGRIFDDIDGSELVVLGSPVNCGSMTAVTKALFERACGYSYWPWGQNAPKLRNPKPVRQAIVVTSSAMPGVIGRFATSGIKGLKWMAKIVGARTILSYHTGLVSQQEHWTMPDRLARRIAREVSGAV